MARLSWPRWLVSTQLKAEFLRCVEVCCLLRKFALRKLNLCVMLQVGLWTGVVTNPDSLSRCSSKTVSNLRKHLTPASEPDGQHRGPHARFQDERTQREAPTLRRPTLIERQAIQRPVIEVTAAVYSSSGFPRQLRHALYPYSRK